MAEQPATPSGSLWHLRAKGGLQRGLNLSVLDGWWPEGYNGRNGWAIGQEIEGLDPAAQDDLDANSLYDLLEYEVIPMFYERDEQGIPRRWIARMKEAIRTLNPVFNTDRMVAEYVLKIYEPQPLEAEVSRTLSSSAVVG